MADESSETSPLLHKTSSRKINDPAAKTKTNVVEFDSEHDVEDPMQWPKAYKSFVVFLLALMAFTV